MGKRYCLGHGRNVRPHRRRGLWVTDLADFLDDDDDEELGDGEGWAEMAGGRQPWLTGGAGDANK